MPLFLVVVSGMSTFLLMESLYRDGDTWKSHQLSSIQLLLHFLILLFVQIIFVSVLAIPSL